MVIKSRFKQSFNHSPLSLTALIGLCGTFLPSIPQAQTLELYVDQITKQVYTEPGRNRIKLGTFSQLPEPSSKEAKQAPLKPTDKKRVDAVEERVTKGEKAIEELQIKTQDEWVAVESLEERMTPVEKEAKRLNDLFKDPTSPALFGEALKGKWYERISIRGYTQFRISEVLSGNEEDFFIPADRSVSDTASFFIRRGRVIFSGDVADHVFLYVQPEFNAQPATGSFALQLRDLYGDISIDKEKEFRFRLGQSKVPFGFVNLQSSQNRAPLERPEALNSAVETERDIGVFFYWAPDKIRQRFKDLVKNGLKGSGDYGVLGLGAYAGQGPNREDLDGDVTLVARLTYPFEFENGQIFEPGIQAYSGRFVPTTSSIPVGPDGTDVTPTITHEDGLQDERIAFSAVWYPQPVGFEAEWTFGRGPELSEDMTEVDVGFLHGGYGMLNVKLDSPYGNFFPFVRWQYFDGARKFAANAPRVQELNELDFGLEYSPFPEVEVAAVYSHTFDRTDTSSFPYEQFDGDRIGLQVQWNY